MRDLGIVIVSWNTRELLRRCLQTVFESEGDFSYRVVVVDNASDDDSAAMVTRDFPQVDLIAGRENVGYPGATMSVCAVWVIEAREMSMMRRPDTPSCSIRIPKSRRTRSII